MATIDLNLLEELYRGDPPSPARAFAIQKELSKRVIRKCEIGRLNTVAGADLSVMKSEGKLVCGIILFSYPDLTEIERVFTVCDEKFPYIPGLLAFREGPAIIETYGKLKQKPDLLIIDGQGIAHPRGFGIACHVGVVLGIPTLGIAKKKLYGTYEEPGSKKGLWSPLLSKKGEVIGSVLRTKDGTKPVFVSLGNKLDTEKAREIALECARGYRIPEPTRRADVYVAELKKKVNGYA
ncbi:MAG TPA: endonuclease V [Thermodesulfobacteriota bacterium]|nr:endonuclease V [Thermodesulfobacteriota bacterium]